MNPYKVRPMFLLLFYFIVLFIIIVMPTLGAFGIVSSNGLDGFFSNVKKGFSAIPDGMWAVFGLGYSLYTGARTYEKSKGVQNN